MYGWVGVGGELGAFTLYVIIAQLYCNHDHT